MTLLIRVHGGEFEVEFAVSLPPRRDPEVQSAIPSIFLAGVSFFPCLLSFDRHLVMDSFPPVSGPEDDEGAMDTGQVLVEIQPQEELRFTCKYRRMSSSLDVLDQWIGFKISILRSG